MDIEQAEKFNKKEYMGTYYQANKEHYREQHDEYRLRKMRCECGCEIKCYNQAKHKRSEKHKQLMRYREVKDKLDELEKKNK